MIDKNYFFFYFQLKNKHFWHFQQNLLIEIANVAFFRAQLIYSIYFIYAQSWEKSVTAAKTLNTTCNKIA